MKANKLTPRHAAPVQREINTTSSEGGTGLAPLYVGLPGQENTRGGPFAGDDAE